MHADPSRVLTCSRHSHGARCCLQRVHRRQLAEHLKVEDDQYRREVATQLQFLLVAPFLREKNQCFACARQGMVSYR